MNLLFLLPSVGYGLFLFANTGSPLLLTLSGLTLLVWLIVNQQRSIPTEGEVRVQDCRVWIGERRLGQAPWLWGSKVRNLVYSTLFAPAPLTPSVSMLPTGAVGLTPEGVPLDLPANSVRPHTLIVGPTGSGKTVLAKRLLAAFPGPVAVIDFKGGFDYRELNLDQLFTQQDAGQAEDFIQRRLSEPQAPLLLVVDELAEVVRHPRLGPLVETVCAKGRSLGVWFVGITQTSGGIPRAVWANCHNRIVIAADAIDRVQLGFDAKSGTAELGWAELKSDSVTRFWFPAASREASKPASAPDAESTQSHQTLADQSSAGEPPEPQRLRGHPLERIVQLRTSQGLENLEPASRTAQR